MTEMPKIQNIKNIRYFNLLFILLQTLFFPKIEVDEKNNVKVSSLCNLLKFCLLNVNSQSGKQIFKILWHRLEENLGLLKEKSFLTKEEISKLIEFLKEEFINKTPTEIKDEFYGIGKISAKTIQGALPYFITVISRYLPEQEQDSTKKPQK